MTDDDLKRMLGMNAAVETLNAAEFDALIYRIAMLCPEHRLQIEAILRRDLQSHAELANRLGAGLSSTGGTKNNTFGPARFRIVRTIVLVFIAIHSVAVTFVMLRLFHR